MRNPTLQPHKRRTRELSSVRANTPTQRTHEKQPDPFSRAEKRSRRGPQPRGMQRLCAERMEMETRAGRLSAADCASPLDLPAAVPTLEPRADIRRPAPDAPRRTHRRVPDPPKVALAARARSSAPRAPRRGARAWTRGPPLPGATLPRAPAAAAADAGTVAQTSDRTQTSDRARSSASSRR